MVYGFLSRYSIQISGEDSVPILPDHSCPTVLSAAFSKLRESTEANSHAKYSEAKRTRLEQTNWLRLTESSWPMLISKILKQK